MVRENCKMKASSIEALARREPEEEAEIVVLARREVRRGRNSIIIGGV